MRAHACVSKNDKQRVHTRTRPRTRTPTHTRGARLHTGANKADQIAIRASLIDLGFSDKEVDDILFAATLLRCVRVCVGVCVCVCDMGMNAKEVDDNLFAATLLQCVSV